MVFLVNCCQVLFNVKKCTTRIYSIAKHIFMYSMYGGCTVLVLSNNFFTYLLKHFLIAMKTTTD
jgi:hypothetical protein